MKTITITVLFFFMITSTTISAQESNNSEKYGKTLNAGIGIGYYGYVGHSIPVLHANYEFDVMKNFTLAPFITFYTYQKNYYWGNKTYPDRYYNYNTTVIPVGIKGTYYFDQLFKANSKWDFYASGSLGFSIQQTRWESGYYGNKTLGNGPNGLYLDIHVGSEYHFNNKLGLYLDLSTGISTFGISAHL